MNDDFDFDSFGKKTTGKVIVEGLAMVIAIFLIAVPLFFAYRWFAWNFNLPAMTYMEMVAVYTGFRAVCKVLRNIFHG